MITGVAIFLNILAWAFAISGGVSLGLWNETRDRSHVHVGLAIIVVAALLQVAAIVVMP